MDWACGGCGGKQEGGRAMVDCGIGLLMTVGGGWQNFIHCLEARRFAHLWRAFSRVSTMK